MAHRINEAVQLVFNLDTGFNEIKKPEKQRYIVSLRLGSNRTII